MVPETDSYVNVQHWLDFRAYTDASVRNKFAVHLARALNHISFKNCRGKINSVASEGKCAKNMALSECRALLD